MNIHNLSICMENFGYYFPKSRLLPTASHSD